MRVWVDLTNSPHVLVFRPLIALLRERGHEVEVTAREYAQTMQLLELHGIEATSSATTAAPRRSGRRAPSSRACRRCGTGRSRARVRPRARPRLARPDADRALAGDPERDHVRLRVRLAPAPARLPRGDACGRPGGDSAGAARPVRRPTAKLRRYPGLKEEYYLADFEPEPVELDRSRSTAEARSSSCARRRRSRSTTGTAIRSSRTCSSSSARDEGIHAVVLPRTDEQREAIRGARAPVADRPRPRGRRAEPDRRSPTVVVSAGGTMNREAVALGVPVYTTFGGRLGAVDEELIREGRLQRLERPDGPRPRQRCRRTASGSGATRTLLLDLLPRPWARPRATASTSLAVALELRRPDARDRTRARPDPRRRPAISASVELWKTTYAGTSSAARASSRHALQRLEAGSSGSSARPRRAARRARPGTGSACRPRSAPGARFARVIPT